MRVSLIGLVILLFPLAISCHRVEAAKTKQILIHLAGQDMGGSQAAIITKQSTFIDEVTATGEQGNTTRLTARVMRLDLARSGGGAYDEAGYMDIGINDTPLDGGLVGEEAYYILKKSAGYFMYKQTRPVNAHAVREIYLGRARPVFYESEQVTISVNGSDIKLLDLVTGEFREIPETRLALIQDAAKLSLNIKFSQSICISNGIILLAYVRSDDEKSSLLISEIANSAKEPIKIDLAKKYTQPKVKAIPTSSGQVTINVYGDITGGKFGFESFRLLNNKEGNPQAEHAFKKEFKYGEVDSLRIVDWK